CAIGADQSGRSDPRPDASRNDADAVQHSTSGRDYFGDADFSGDEPVERRHFASAVVSELGGDDHTVKGRSFVKPPNPSAILRNELRAGTGQSVASHDSV